VTVTLTVTLTVTVTVTVMLVMVCMHEDYAWGCSEHLQLQISGAQSLA
jgi:hypothetical protein